jgi:hypothetical protein
MLGFLLGVVAGTIVMYNKDGARRALATALVKGEEAVAAAGQLTRRVAAQVSEDLEDIVAEARADLNAQREREASEKSGSGDTGLPTANNVHSDSPISSGNGRVLDPDGIAGRGNA